MPRVGEKEGPMPDIQLRFGKDMLVLSGSIDETLTRQGITTALDMPYLILMEPDTILDALKLQSAAGAQCLITPTHNIAPARLAYTNTQADGQTIAENAISIVQQLNPQHVLVDIGPCGLPLDSSSAPSLKEHKEQYLKAARFFDDCVFDAFFLNGFTSLDDLKCALMGLRQASDKPIFASVTLGANNVQGEPEPDAEKTTYASEDSKETNDFDLTSIKSGLPLLGYEVFDEHDSLPPKPSQQTLDPTLWTKAIDIMLEYEASVVGFETADPLNLAYDYAVIARQNTNLPLLASLRVIEDPLNARQKGLTPLEDLKEYTPDTLFQAGQHLHRAGVQFLRATGNALASSTGALVAATNGLDVAQDKQS